MAPGLRATGHNRYHVPRDEPMASNGDDSDNRRKKPTDGWEAILEDERTPPVNQRSYPFDLIDTDPGAGADDGEELPFLEHDDEVFEGDVFGAVPDLRDGLDDDDPTLPQGDIRDPRDPRISAAPPRSASVFGEQPKIDFKPMRKKILGIPAGSDSPFAGNASVADLFDDISVDSVIPEPLLARNRASAPAPSDANALPRGGLAPDPNPQVTLSTARVGQRLTDPTRSRSQFRHKKILLIVLLVLAGVALVVGGYHAYRTHVSNQREHQIVQVKASQVEMERRRQEALERNLRQKELGLP
jgi:hypothetical protein